MFKNLLPVAIIILFFYLPVSGEPYVKPDHLTRETENTIVSLVCEAVEDTTWLYVTSPVELELILERYYTGPLLQEIRDQAWDFVRIPNSWDLVIKAGQCRMVFISADAAEVCIEVIETDEITGVSYYTQLEYFLKKTDAGWRIAARKVRPGY
jgi:hypothetical protein